MTDKNCKTYFTDEEYRILLSALRRERTVCEETDKIFDDHKLATVVDSIEKKIKNMNYYKA